MKSRLPKTPKFNDLQLWESRLAIFRFPCVTVAHELGLFETLKTGKPVASGEIARLLGVSPQGARVLCQVLWGMDFLDSRDGDRFKLAPLGKDFALDESPFSWKNAFSMYREKQPHQELMDGLRKDGAQVSHGGKSYTDMWESGTLDEKAAAIFTDRMHSYIFAPAIGAVATGAFGGVKSLLDVGGGSGAFCIAFADRYKKAQAAVFDLPAVCQVAESYVRKYGFSERVKSRPGNFCRQALPQGYDGILFSNILHDWGPERCQELARKSFEALPSGGRILIHEMLFDPKERGPLLVSLFSMLMFMSHPGGRQYSFEELTGFLKKAGFKSVKRVKGFGGYSLVVGTKP